MPVTLNGTVTSNGLPTTVDFQYGRTTNYNRTVTATQSPLAAGAVASAVSAVLTGLQEGTLYHYRVVGVNSSGATYGSDMTFTPVAAPAAVDVATAFKVALWTGTNVAGRAIPAIDLSGGGVIFIRRRNAVDTPRMYLSANGTNVYGADTLNPANTYATPPITFTSSGFTLTDTTHNATGGTYVAWCFKKTPRFCDVVTYTGDGTTAKVVAHGVTTVPSRMVVTRVDGTLSTNGPTRIYDNNAGNTKSMAFTTDFVTSTNWNNTSPTTSVFTVSSVASSADVNGTGIPYAAAVFAHDVAADGVIKVCSWVGNGTTSGPTVNLGWQPQLIMGPREYAGSASNTHAVYDTTRSPGFTGDDAETYLGDSFGPESVYPVIALVANGFQPVISVGEINGSGATYSALVVKA